MLCSETVPYIQVGPPADLMRNPRATATVTMVFWASSMSWSATHPQTFSK